MKHEVLRRALNARVMEVVPDPTPLDRAVRLSDRLGYPIWFKREDTTSVFSFKLRGAYNKIALLTEAERKAGVVAASAGNHAQGVAFASGRHGIRCRIVMPRTTPRIKVDAVRRLGAKVELFGDGFADAARRARELADELKLTQILPFDDLDVIAGQATVGLELMRQAPRDLRSIFIPVGGGGLAAGVAAVVKDLRPEVRVIGVEPDDADAMRQSLAAGHRVKLDHVGIFADGVAVTEVGKHTFELCREYLDECIVVTSDEICAAIQDGFEDTRSILEPAGALGIAGIKRVARGGGLAPGSAVAVTSGANVNFSRLRYLTERAEVGANREAVFAVTIPERSGEFLTFCRAIGERGVTEFNYRMSSRSEAQIFVGVQVTGRAEAREVVTSLGAAGYATVDLSDDELAKSHVRHMVGGRTRLAENEVLFRFEFPERPGALLEFLSSLSGRWNISLFHYRNHGAAYGSVLCGLEVPRAERAELHKVLKRIGYTYVDVSESAAAKLFL